MLIWRRCHTTRGCHRCLITAQYIVAEASLVGRDWLWRGQILLLRLKFALLSLLVATHYIVIGAAFELSRLLCEVDHLQWWATI